MAIFLSNKIKGAKDAGAIGFDSITEWSVDESAKVSSNPVENGADVTDNYSLEPTQVSFSGVVSPWNFTGKGTDNTPEEFIRKMQNIKQEGTPVDIFLSDDLQPISSCLITSFTYQRTAAEGQSIKINLTAQQIRKVSRGEAVLLDDLALAPDVSEQGQGSQDGGDAPTQRNTYVLSTLDSGIRVVTANQGSILE